MFFKGFFNKPPAEVMHCLANSKNNSVQPPKFPSTSAGTFNSTRGEKKQFISPELTDCVKQTSYCNEIRSVSR